MTTKEEVDKEYAKGLLDWSRSLDEIKTEGDKKKAMNKLLELTERVNAYS